MSEVAELMKRCQRGVGGRNALDEAHDIMAECYGTLGRLESERDALEAENARLQSAFDELAERYGKLQTGEDSLLARVVTERDAALSQLAAIQGGMGEVRL